MRVTGAASEAAKRVELHDHIRDGDIMRMRRIEGISIPAGSAAQLAPGGKHVMLIGLTAPLTADTDVSFRLQFEDGSEHSFSAPVRRIGASHAH